MVLSDFTALPAPLKPCPIPVCSIFTSSALYNVSKMLCFLRNANNSTPCPQGLLHPHEILFGFEITARNN